MKNCFSYTFLTDKPTTNEKKNINIALDSRRLCFVARKLKFMLNYEASIKNNLNTKKIAKPQKLLAN